MSLINNNDKTSQLQHLHFFVTYCWSSTIISTSKKLDYIHLPEPTLSLPLTVIIQVKPETKFNKASLI